MMTSPSRTTSSSMYNNNNNPVFSPPNHHHQKHKRQQQQQQQNNNNNNNTQQYLSPMKQQQQYNQIEPEYVFRDSFERLRLRNRKGNDPILQHRFIASYIKLKATERSFESEKQENERNSRRRRNNNNNAMVDEEEDDEMLDDRCLDVEIVIERSEKNGITTICKLLKPNPLLNYYSTRKDNNSDDDDSDEEEEEEEQQQQQKCVKFVKVYFMRRVYTIKYGLQKGMKIRLHHGYILQKEDEKIFNDPPLFKILFPFSITILKKQKLLIHQFQENEKEEKNEEEEEEEESTQDLVEEDLLFDDSISNIEEFRSLYHPPMMSEYENSKKKRKQKQKQQEQQLHSTPIRNQLKMNILQTPHFSRRTSENNDDVDKTTRINTTTPSRLHQTSSRDDIPLNRKMFKDQDVKWLLVTESQYIKIEIKRRGGEVEIDSPEEIEDDDDDDDVIMTTTQSQSSQSQEQQRRRRIIAATPRTPISNRKRMYNEIRKEIKDVYHYNPFFITGRVQRVFHKEITPFLLLEEMYTGQACLVLIPSSIEYFDLLWESEGKSIKLTKLILKKFQEFPPPSIKSKNNKKNNEEEEEMFEDLIPLDDLQLQQQQYKDLLKFSISDLKVFLKKNNNDNNSDDDDDDDDQHLPLRIARFRCTYASTVSEIQEDCGIKYCGIINQIGNNNEKKIEINQIKEGERISFTNAKLIFVKRKQHTMYGRYGSESILQIDPEKAENHFSFVLFLALEKLRNEELMKDDDEEEEEEGIKKKKRFDILKMYVSDCRFIKTIVDSMEMFTDLESSGINISLKDCIYRGRNRITLDQFTNIQVTEERYFNNDDEEEEEENEGEEEEENKKKKKKGFIDEYLEEINFLEDDPHDFEDKIGLLRFKIQRISRERNRTYFLGCEFCKNELEDIDELFVDKIEEMTRYCKFCHRKVNKVKRYLCLIGHVNTLARILEKKRTIFRPSSRNTYSPSSVSVMSNNDVLYNEKQGEVLLSILFTHTATSEMMGMEDYECSGKETLAQADRALVEKGKTFVLPVCIINYRKISFQFDIHSIGKYEQTNEYIFNTLSEILV